MKPALPSLLVLAFVLPANAADQRVGFLGYGPAHIGMTRATLQDAIDAQRVLHGLSVATAASPTSKPVRGMALQ